MIKEALMEAFDDGVETKGGQESDQMQKSVMAGLQSFGKSFSRKFKKLKFSKSPTIEKQEGAIVGRLEGDSFKSKLSGAGHVTFYVSVTIPASGKVELKFYINNTGGAWGDKNGTIKAIDNVELSSSEMVERQLAQELFDLGSYALTPSNPLQQNRLDPRHVSEFKGQSEEDYGLGPSQSYRPKSQEQTSMSRPISDLGIEPEDHKDWGTKRYADAPAGAGRVSRTGHRY
jgi:hypothetical protein